MGPPDLMYMSWPLQTVYSFLPPLLYPWDCRSCYQGRYFCLVSLALCDSQSNATQQLKQHPCEVSQVWMFSMSQSIYRKKIKRSQATFFRATKTTYYSQTVSYLHKEKISHLIQGGGSCLILKRKVFFNRWMLRKSGCLIVLAFHFRKYLDKDDIDSGMEGKVWIIIYLIHLNGVK